MPIVCAGVQIDPGDIIVADDDGAICIPPALVMPTVEKARMRAAREVKIRAAIDEGKVLFDILNLQAALDASGVEEIDGTWQG